MKILYLITKSNFGGAQKYVFELANAANEAGHEVSVACGGTGEKKATSGLLADRLQVAGIKVHIIQNFMRNMSLAQDFFAFIEVWRLLRAVRPDVLHVTSSKAGGIGAAAGRLVRVPNIIFTSHGLTMDEVWRPRWQQLLITVMTWTTLQLAHRSIMINTETFERAIKMPRLENKMYLIKNGIRQIAFIERDEARALLAPELPPNALWLGGVGELHPNKNWATVIHTLTTLPQEIHFVLLGDGEERKQLELLTNNLGLENRVHLLGYVKDAQRYLQAFDIFILPSKKEGLPYVLLEAGLAELPTIASDLPGNRDIIETGMTGLLVEPNPTLLTATLQFLLRDDGVRRRLGQAFKAHVEQEFTIERMAEQTFALYDSSKSRV